MAPAFFDGVTFGRGWDYGYIFPAMNRAIQAAGRGIKSGTDRGAIVLMDECFRWRNYAKCFPADLEFIVSETPTKYLQRFFRPAPTKEELEQGFQSEGALMGKNAR